LGNIINSKSQTRLQNLITGTKGTIVIGGRTECKRIEPTVVKDVTTDDVLMDEFVQLCFFDGYIFDGGPAVKSSDPFFQSFL
jgi:hypothetical protein